MARLAMNELTTYRWSFEEDMQHYRAAGFQGIGLWRDKLADFGEERGLELLAESNLAVSSLSWAGGFTGSDGRPHLDAIEDGLDAIRLAASLNAECLIVHSGARGGHTNKHVRRLFYLALEEMLAVAEPQQVTLAIEPMHSGCGSEWTFLNDLDESLELLARMGSSHLKLAFDAYHLGHDDSALERLASVAEHLAIVQLGDARSIPRGEPSRCRLGEGVLPLEGMVGTLLHAGYQGFFEIELMGEEIETADYHDLLLHSHHVFHEFVAGARA